MAKKNFKMVLAKHLKSDLKTYIARYNDTYYKRVAESGAIKNIEDIISIKSDNLEVDLAKLRKVENSLNNLSGSQRTIVSNFVTSTLNLIGLSKVKGLDFTNIKPMSY